ncbi:hypothetical protein Adt_12854 [Abeliophyllum distichum]|uniref:Uncharacterized protein n=1 Tax=Abeliophyllum distichum TaxID=126358 RepID=A0ABD1URW8_9LAMI
MEENEAVCKLQCEERTSAGNQFTHSDDEDDGMTDIEKEIDLEVGRRIKGILYNNILIQLYQEGNPVIGFLGELSRRSFDYYVLYKTPTRKKMVPRNEKYGSPPIILPPPIGWEEPSEDIVQIEKAKGIHGKEILQANISNMIVQK